MLCKHNKDGYINRFSSNFLYNFLLFILINRLSSFAKKDQQHLGLMSGCIFSKFATKV